jgi:hypothetical protein
MCNFLCFGAIDRKNQLEEHQETNHAANLGLSRASLLAGPEAGGLCLRTYMVVEHTTRKVLCSIHDPKSRLVFNFL